MQSYILNLKIKINLYYLPLLIWLTVTENIRARKINTTGRELILYHPRVINNHNIGMIISRFD